MDKTVHPIILITGASSGIGESTARLFASRGYCAVLASRRIERLANIADEINTGGGKALVIPADVSKMEDIHNLVDTTLRQYERIDVLFNNAGFGRLDWLENLDENQDIEPQVQVNLLGVIECCRAVLPSMITSKRGHIINMSSLAGWIGTPTYSIYAASKFGVRGFTEALRREVSVYGVQVSGIYPGAVDTEFNQHARIRRKTGLSTPARMRLRSSDVAEAVWKLVQHPRRSMVIPRIMWAAIWLNTLFPGLADWTIEKRFVAKERGEKSVIHK